jgi:hypothetical protein
MQENIFKVLTKPKIKKKNFMGFPNGIKSNFKHFFGLTPGKIFPIRMLSISLKIFRQETNPNY